jgi:hypothetical protein
LTGLQDLQSVVIAVLKGAARSPDVLVAAAGSCTGAFVSSGL